MPLPKRLRFQVGFVWLTLLASCNPHAAPVIQEDGTQPPNIVILFADDLGYGDVGVYGNPTIRTPNIDEMASSGAKFTQFYTGSPACTASRYALLTGRQPVRSGFGWVLNPDSPRGLHENEVTLAEALKSAGYVTAAFGKWHLGSTEISFLPLQNGFDEYLGLPYSNDMLPPRWPPIPLIEDNLPIEVSPDQSTLTRRYTERATQFIRKHADRPFFLYVPYAMPHIPLHPGADFEGTSRRGLFGDVVEEIDWSVGEIRRALAAAGLDDNTLLIFTSDNGPWIIKNELGGSSGLLRDGKGSTWEGGIRVPMLAEWTGKIVPRSVVDAPATTLDLFSTALALAGVDLQTDRVIDGKDISSLLFSSSRSVADRVLFHYGLGNELFAVRKGPWKLHIKTYSQTGVDYFGGKLPLLFHLDHDPSERYEISDDHPDVVADLQHEILVHQRSLGANPSFYE